MLLGFDVDQPPLSAKSGGCKPLGARVAWPHQLETRFTPGSDSGRCRLYHRANCDNKGLHSSNWNIAFAIYPVSICSHRLSEFLSFPARAALTHVDHPSLPNMTALSAAEEMDKLQLSEEDTEDLWDSPSKRHAKTPKQKAPRAQDVPPESAQPRNGETLFDLEETREAALRNELQSVRNINQVIEGLLESLDRAKGNMTVCQLYIV